MDREEGETVRSIAGKGSGDKWLGVVLVLDGAEVSGAIGVADTVGLEIIDVEPAAVDEESNVGGV
jgi:hypothetical protein